VSSSAPIGHVRIPGYTIQREVGRGGIATVYLAIQESLDRQVALKVMAPALAADPNFTERFIREGRTVAQLAHPGIVTIYDISVADYQHYIAMEYLGSGSLKERMHKRIAPATALSILRQVAAALGYAHEKGFVHRDVKPENIIFRGKDAPVLTDFGIAKSTESSTQLTSVGVIVGTPRYMSPEQADGRGTDPRSDIYALGVILFEMLTGRPPFDSTESIAILYSHINDPIPELPEEFSSFQPLVNAMLAKEPDQRVPDSESLIEMVRTAQRGERGIKRADPSGSASSRGKRERRATGKRRDGVIPLLGWSGAAFAMTIVAAVLLKALVDPAPEKPVSMAGKADQVAAVSDETIPTMPEPESPASAMLAPVQPVTSLPPAAATPEDGSMPAPAATMSQPVAKDLQANAGQSDASDEPTGKTGSGAAIESPPRQAEVGKTGQKWRQRATNEEHIDVLLQLANKQILQDRLSYPEGDNALESYRSVLSIDPANAEAQAGLENLAQVYLNRAQKKANEGKYQSALLYVERGLSASPSHDGLQTLQRKSLDMIEAEKLFAEAEREYRGVERPGNVAAAVALYRKAAELGHPGAQYNLAVSYANGIGVSADEVEAMRWLRKAARKAGPEAQYNLSLGLMFGPRPEPRTAARIIKRLAEEEYAPAYRVLGWIYNTGRGLDRSITESVRWATKDFTKRRLGNPPLPDRVIDSWQQRFEWELREAAKLVEQSS
jgi:TPR repeat protein